MTRCAGGSQPQPDILSAGKAQPRNAWNWGASRDLLHRRTTPRFFYARQHDPYPAI